MNDPETGFVEKPRVRPEDPRFSSGPCRKHPGWSLERLATSTLGRSHRAAEPKARLSSAITRSASLLGLPEEWQLGIVPGSDTGAFEMAIWSLLGFRPVDAFVWESFSSDWAKDLSLLALPELHVHEAAYGFLPDLAPSSPDHDVVFVYNGTTSGVRVPDLDWLTPDREGLVLCDATSAAFAMPIDFSCLDVVTWSWQKVLGGEAAHGMLALSPRAVARLESEASPRALPKVFRLTKGGKLIDGIFRGETINTPSMLAVEDLHSALDWADSLGGLDALHKRSQDNFTAVDNWIAGCDWADWLAEKPQTRSCTSMCLKLSAGDFTALPLDEQQGWIKTMAGWLADEGVALDIANYRSAPPGFRLWGGATVETSDLEALLPWLDWASQRARQAIRHAETSHV
ncbi:MAG: phosphoserine transaminase [Granulosicoccus sp.]|nr:phosphoserine transaminase [Granulosicoccus sp.]